jgi:hypothetical protein
MPSGALPSEHDHALLHADRDFDAIESLRGLKVWRH